MNKMIIFIGVFCIYGLCLAQEKLLTKMELARLDTLILNGNYIDVNEFFLEKDRYTYQNEYDSTIQMTYNYIKRKYLEAVTKIENLNSQQEDIKVNFIKQVKYSSIYYSEEYAGKKSFTIYRKALQSINNDNIKNVIHYFTIASLYKDIHIYAVSKIVRDRIKSSYQLLRSDSLDQALKLINNLHIATNNNSRLESIADSLIQLREMISEEINLIRSQRLFLKKQDIKKFSSISIAPTFVLQNAIVNSELFVKDIYSDEIIGLEIPKIPFQQRFGYRLRMQLHLYRNISFGLTYHYASFNYNSDLMQQLIFFDFDVHSQSSHIYIQHLLNYKTRLRSFINIGLGMNYLKYDPISVKSSFSNDDEDVAILIGRKFFKGSKNIISYQFFGEFGIEYVPSNANRMFYSISMPIYVNLDSNLLNQRYLYTFCLSVGYKF